MAQTSRRKFLKLLLALYGVGITGTLRANGEPVQRTGSDYAVLPWEGDDFTRGHELRDGRLPAFPDKAESRVDFVIIGGGMAGLAAAHFLGDRDFILLEQYQHTGGTSSGGSYRGIDYSRGAVCTGSDTGLKGQLFHELNIKPVIIPPEETAWHSSGEWFRTIQGNDKFHRQLQRLMAETQELYLQHKDRLGSTTFSSCLSGYDPEFLALVNGISHSFFCAGSDYISARAGCFMVRALTTNSYVFDGGNSAIARALKKSVDDSGAKRIRTGCFVWSVQKRDKGASVVFTGPDGRTQRIDCKHAVVAVPPLVAQRIIAELPEPVMSTFKSTEYGSFIVANFCMPKKILQYPYQNFADEPYPFGQMVLAEAPYMASGRYKPDMGSVLTVYHPFEHGPIGRGRLLTANREKFAANTLAELSKIFEPLQGHVEQIELTRWGHGGIVPTPTVTENVARSNQFTTDWLTYAHSTAGGGQSLDGAITAGRNAADRCLKLSS